MHNYNSIKFPKVNMKLSYSTLITTYGVSENAYSGEIQSIITAENLFAE